MEDTYTLTIINGSFARFDREDVMFLQFNFLTEEEAQFLSRISLERGFQVVTESENPKLLKDEIGE